MKKDVLVATLSIVILFVIFFGVVGIVSLVQKMIPEKPSSTEFIKGFREFHDFSEKEVYQMKSGLSVSYHSLDKGKDGSKPTVVFTLYVHATVQEGFEEGYPNEQESYKAACKWMKLPVDQRKKDLREAADPVMDFAIKEGWTNYYLYVQLFSFGHNVLYDYETDSLWVPEDEETRVEMCEKFGSFDREDVAKTKAGQDYLVEKGWAYWDKKQLKIESDYGGIACRINIDSEGNVMDLRDRFHGFEQK